MKNKFRVWVKTTDYLYLDVEANNADEAVVIAEESDGGDFTQVDEKGDWHILDDVVELDEEGNEP